MISIRKTSWKSALREFAWFLSGSNKISDLHESVRDWWAPWVDKFTQRVEFNYGHAFCKWNGWLNQIEELQVLHDCDNPSCCNPKHLFLGTCQDNVNDMFNKERENKAKGISHGMSKLTEEDVIKIREKYGVIFS